MLLAAFMFGAGLFFGGLGVYMYGLPPTKYENPYLHEGHWEGPDLVGSVGKQRAVWRAIGHTVCAGTNHGPAKCEVGPGIAHVDTCICGKQRSGVHGAWC